MGLVGWEERDLRFGGKGSRIGTEGRDWMVGRKGIRWVGWEERH
jgi:hypothetical protein